MVKTRNHKLWAIPALAGLVFGLTACATDEQTNEPTPTATEGPVELFKLEVAVSHAEDVNGLTFKVAQQQGFFEAHGLEVEVIPGSGGGGSDLQNVLNGDLPFGVVSTAAIINAYQNGAPIQVVSGLTQSAYELGWGVPVDSPIQSLEDAANATWSYTSPGSVTEAMSWLIPHYAGIPVDSVERVSAGGTGEGIALLEAGGSDITFVPPVVQLANEDTLRVVFRGSDYIPAYQTTMIVSNRDFSEKNPEVTREFLLAHLDAIEWIAANVDAAGDIYASGANLDQAQARDVVRNYQNADQWGIAFNPDALESVAIGLNYTHGIETIDWVGLLDDSYLPEGHKGSIPSN